MPSLLSSKPLHLQKSAEYSQPPPKGQAYSVALANSEKSGRSKVYRHWRFRDGVLETLDPSIRTAHDIFESTATRLPHSPCLGYRPYSTVKRAFGPYEWIDYETVQQRRAVFGAGLIEIHAREGVHGANYGVGLWCQNRPEWQITDLACMSQSLYTVSLYDTLGPEASEYIIRHANLSCVVTSLPHVPILLKLKPRLPDLKLIVVLDSLQSTTNEQPELSKKSLLAGFAQDLGVKVYSMEEVEALGVSLHRPYNPPQPTDFVTINYTSGTTGAPKGVTLTHANAVAAASSGLCMATQNDSDVVCSYLPLAHIYQRVIEHCCLWAGSRIGYFHGNVVELVDDLKLLRPTAFASVPRLYNRFGGVIKASTIEAPGFKGALSRHIVRTKTANFKDKDNPTNKHMVYDRIWGKKVAAALGLDRAKSCLSGSAPIDPQLQQFMQIVLGTRVYQGYGLTETYACSLVQSEGDFATGTCGGVAPCGEICLMSLPDMEYSVDDKPYPRGELLIRGATNFTQYFKNEDATKDAFTEDGWFKSGDIASIDELGRVRIIDRRKNVLKLAQGEYVSPERLENIYLSNCNYLAQAMVHGDSQQTFLVAIFGVQPDIFASFASKVLGSSIGPTDMAAMSAACRQDKVRQAVLKDLDKVGRKNKFAGFERVRNIYLYVEPFSIDNELLTPTLKLKRPVAAKRYRAELDALYEEALAAEKAGQTVLKAKL